MAISYKFNPFTGNFDAVDTLVAGVDYQAPGDYITALTGGVTATGPGSVVATVITNANLSGPITSVGNTTAIASQTGTGTKFVVDTSPILVTPNIGVATATSIAIGVNTLDTNEWANLDGLNQTLATTSSPTFVNITGTSFVIGANTLTTAEWAFLDGQDQAVASTSSPTFVNLTITSVTVPTIYGSAASGGNLTLFSTSHATNKGNLFFGTSTYDEVNNRLGIGTLAPFQKLEVAGSIVATGNYSATGGAGVYIYYNSGGFLSAQDPGNNYKILEVNGLTLNFKSANVITQSLSTAIYVDSNQLVGISTAVPAAKFHITGNVSAASWTTNGLGFRVAAATYTDTDGAGTRATGVAHSFGAPTIAASNAVTITEAANVFINGNVTAGANMTITNNYGLWIKGTSASLSTTSVIDGVVGTNFLMRRTSAPTTTGQKLGIFGGGANDDVSTVPALGAFLNFQSAGAWTETSHPSQASMQVTPSGATGQTNAQSWFSNGRVGFGGVAAASSLVHIGAGNVNRGPLTMDSGTVMTAPIAGSIEFTTDEFFGTITTGPARKTFIMNDGTRLTATRVPFATTNGRLTDDADMTFTTDTLTVTKIGTTTMTGTTTHTGSMIVKSVTDAGPMTATNGTVAEIVYNTSNSKFYGCTITGTPATWAALN